jgi:hypothetical protein
MVAAFVAGAVGLDLALLGYGLTRTPTAFTAGSGWAGFLILAAVLLCCPVLAWRGPLAPRGHVLRVAVPVGLAAGVVLAVAGNAGYLSGPLAAAGTAFGLVMIAAVVLGAALAGFLGGPRAAVWSAVFGYLVWYPTVLLSYYAASGTPALDRYLSAEGTYDDFHRSGMTDLPAFVLQDLVGAGIFHLLLAAAIAAGVGWCAALARRPRPATSG